MKLSFENNNKTYSFESNHFFDISIPMKFNGEQPNTYNVPKAKAEPYKDGTFIGDTRLGGSCNFQTMELTPHCNGTHTECIGHIANDRHYIIDSLKETLLCSKLITIEILTPTNSKETYLPPLNNSDRLITKSEIEKSLQKIEDGFNWDTLIVRTLPNSISKKVQDYLKEEPAFLTIEAASYISEIGVKHLILDVPSLDRTFDEGLLTSHHIFWNVEQSLNNLNHDSRIDNTITEMAFIEDGIIDANYLTNIQIAPFESDASPSRIVIFPLILV